jgi:hypothetical protein
MFELHAHPNSEIRCAAAVTLARLAGNITKSSLLDSVSNQICSSLKNCMEKKEHLMEHAGSLLTLSSLWLQAKRRKVIRQNILNVRITYGKQCYS